MKAINNKDIKQELNKIAFNFDCRHHYTDEAETQHLTPFGWIDLKIKVFFSTDLEEIKSISVLGFNVWDKTGDKIKCNLSEKLILKEIDVN